jgi:hypothetical protein
MQTSKIILYTLLQKNISVEVTFVNDNFWLTQKAMSALFGVEIPAVNKHLANIFETNELTKEATVSKMEIVQQEGNRQVKRNVDFYHLTAVLAVGYRVNSAEATQFRIWATNTLQEYVVKGFVMDDERLKSGKHFGKDYFDEMLERIREIRSSERRFYQKITDIYALSVDYDKESATTKDFFAIVQNKLHWALSGKTAAEIIYTEADATKLYMGLKTWKAAPDGKILKSDVAIAKNYLNEEHIKELNRIVSAYLDLAENNAHRGIAFAMENWVKFLDNFLQLSSYPILINKGKVTMLEAKLKAESEYDKYRVIQDKNYESDFDKVIKGINTLNNKKNK